MTDEIRYTADEWTKKLANDILVNAISRACTGHRISDIMTLRRAIMQIILTADVGLWQEYLKEECAELNRR